MDKKWPDAVLSDSDRQGLGNAVERDLRDLEKDCEEKATFDSLRKTTIALGRLGKGVMVSAAFGSCSCGATGNCAIYLYIRDKGRYREVLPNGKRIVYSSAFAVVNSNSDVPDLVLATHESAFQRRLTKYRYVGDKFVPQACETLTAKDADASPKSEGDQPKMLVQPCETH